MAAAVLRMSDRRLVFVLPEAGAVAVFLATHRRGKPPLIAHEQRFAPGSEANKYAARLSNHFGCSIIAPDEALWSGEDAA